MHLRNKVRSQPRMLSSTNMVVVNSNIIAKKAIHLSQSWSRTATSTTKNRVTAKYPPLWQLDNFPLYKFTVELHYKKPRASEKLA